MAREEILCPRGKEEVVMPCRDLQEPGLEAGRSLAGLGMEEAGQ